MKRTVNVGMGWSFHRKQGRTCPGGKEGRAVIEEVAASSCRVHAGVTVIDRGGHSQLPFCQELLDVMICYLLLWNKYPET